MAYQVPLDNAGAIPLQRARSTCELLCVDATLPVTLTDVTGAGATIETPAQLAIGSDVALRHPHGGTIAAVVAAHHRAGLRLAFAGDERALGFALAVLVAGLS